MKILLIDNDEALGEDLDMYLSNFQHQLYCTTAPNEGKKMISELDPSLVLLDVMLPQHDSLSVCKEIRSSSESYHDIPIIMLNAYSDVSDRVVGLEVGADDYLPKPFEPRELLARISSVMRRHRRISANSRVKPVEKVDSLGLSHLMESRQFVLNGGGLELSTKEYELLALFYSSPGKKWSRDELASRLRGSGSEVYSRALDTLVSRLRQRLGETSKSPKYIQTVWGFGYCFLGNRPKRSLH